MVEFRGQEKDKKRQMLQQAENMGLDKRIKNTKCLTRVNQDSRSARG